MTSYCRAGLSTSLATKASPTPRQRMGVTASRWRGAVNKYVGNKQSETEEKGAIIHPVGWGGAKTSAC
jgi:hypothetical protein